MKHFLLMIFFLLTISKVRSQDTLFNFHQLYELDSIGKTNSISSHFGNLYYDFLLLIEAELSKSDTTTKRLVRNFEMVFAQFYIDACNSCKNNSNNFLPAWQAYFKDTTLQPIQYKLMGANAHLNGGLAEAIAHSYTPEEWKMVKGNYHIFNVCLNTTYKNLYKESIKSNKRLRILRILTLGLDQKYGQFLLYKWRKRQMRLTEYYYEGSPKYAKLLRKINRKKKHLDRMITRYL